MVQLHRSRVPAGVAKAMDEWHLNANRARSLVDLGCGTGKVCMQAFLEHQSLQDLFGVEISKPRYDIAEAAFLRLAAHFPSEFTVLAYQAGRTVTIATPVHPTRMHGHARLDAAGLLANLTGEQVPSSSDYNSDDSDGGASQDYRHPGDRSPQLDGRRGSDDDLSPGLSGEPTSIHISPTMGSATSGSTGGSSMSRASAPAVQAPSALSEKVAPVVARAVSTCNPNSHCSVEYDPSQWRTLRVAWGDMFDTCHVDTADLICIETDVPGACYPLLAALIRSAKKGARVLSYLNLAEMWPQEMRRFFNLEQLAINRSVYDRFWTSWSYVNGHKFYLWQCTRSPLPLQVDVKRHTDGTTHVLVTVPPSVSSIEGGPLIRRIGGGFENSVAEPLSWKTLIPPPVWTWDDVSDIHGAGRRPRLLVFGGLLNNYGGRVEPHEDDTITFSCFLPTAQRIAPSSSTVGDVPQPESCTLHSDISSHDVRTMEGEPLSRESTGTMNDHESLQSSRSATEASRDSGNPVLAHAVSSVKDLDDASSMLPTTGPNPTSRPALGGSSKTVDVSSAAAWQEHVALPGTPDEQDRPSSAFDSSRRRTVHVAR